MLVLNEHCENIFIKEELGIFYNKNLAERLHMHQKMYICTCTLSIIFHTFFGFVSKFCVILETAFTRNKYVRAYITLCFKFVQ